jgi:cation:H+ antiporter
MPLSVKDKTVWREMPFNIFATIVLYLLVNVTFVDGNTFRGLTRIDGIVLLSFFLIFIFYIFIIRKIDLDKKQDVSFPAYSLPSAILMVIGGLVGLTLGGKWIVNSSVSIATNFGVSQSLIGLTIVAIGTSLPELATSVMAVYKKNIDIAIGNIIGSNIFNIFWILGISSLIAPLPFSSSINRDIYIAFIASFLLFLLMFIGKRHLFERWQGVLFVLLYIIYIIFIIMAELVR